MKVNTSKFFVLIFFLIASKCFYLISMPSQYAIGSNIQLEAMIAVAFFVCCGLKVCGIYKHYIIFFLMYIVADCFFTMFAYPSQTLFKTFSMTFSYFLLIGYFPMVWFCRKKENYRYLVSFMTICSVFVATITLMYAFSVNLLGKELFSFNLAYKTFERNGNIRIYYIFENYLRVSQIVSLGWLLQKRAISKSERLLHILNYVLVFAGVIYVDQSRYYLFVVIVVSSFMILKFNKSTGKWIVIGLVLLFIGVTFYDSILTSISTVLNGDRAFGIRIEAIKYFANKAFENPVFGLGLLTPGSRDWAARLLYYGPKLAYYQDDVGIFGFLGGFGVVGAIWYIALLYKTYVLGKDSKENILYQGMLLAMFLCSFTMLWMDKQRLVGMLIALVVLDREAGGSHRYNEDSASVV